VYVFWEEGAGNKWVIVTGRNECVMVTSRNKRLIVTGRVFLLSTADPNGTALVLGTA
jgi:hypothetical protein